MSVAIELNKRIAGQEVPFYALRILAAQMPERVAKFLDRYSFENVKNEAGIS